MKTHRRHRLGLLGTFTVLTVLAMVAIGVVLTTVLTRGAEQTALGRSAEFAKNETRLDVMQALGNDRVDDGLEPTTILRLDALVDPSRGPGRILRAKVWAPGGRVVFSDAHEIIGKTFPMSHHLEEAFAARTSADVTSGDDGEAEHIADESLGELLEIYTPLTDARTSTPIGVVEAYFSYAPVAAEIAQVRRRVAVVVVVGLLALLAILLPIVASASRRLRRQSSRNEHAALHDTLTELPNRRSFVDFVERRLLGRGGEGVLMLLDLDGFKDVNDTLGHAEGDRLLQMVAARLGSVLDDRFLLARLGGDEFGVASATALAAQDAEQVARNLIRSLEEAFTVDEMSIDISASVGVSLAPAHGTDVGSLLRRADIAMYAAKRARRGAQMYTAELEPNGREAMHLVSDLRRAITAGEMRLHYQPKADIGSRSVRSVEALVRWEHPQRGLLLPAAFIDFAERSNLIRPLTEWVLEEAMRQCREWADAGLRLTVAVNLSQASLADDDLPHLIGEVLKRHHLPASALEVEVTETALTGDIDAAARMLGQLDALGVTVAIDDYGIGFSSIAHLRKLPVRCIKIDRAYVSTMADDPKSASIIRSTVELARDLGISAVAEGVETREEWNALSGFDGLIAQGYFVSRPIPADDVPGWFARPAPRAEVDAGESHPGPERPVAESVAAF